jgi:hypothetical protein
MDQPDDKRSGEPYTYLPQGADATGPQTPEHVTLGGTDAGPAPAINPSVGTPSTPALSTPPPVIHRAGDAHPGEANPAAAFTRPDGRPLSTAEMLAAREAAEEALSRGEGQPVPYEDEGRDLALAREDQGGRNMAPDATPTPTDYLAAPHPYGPLASAGAGLEEDTVRMEVKEEANAAVIQQAESMSGADPERIDYERREFGQSQMQELRDDVIVGAMTGPTPPPEPAPDVTAVFAGIDQARAAIEALREIGIPADSISLVARDLGSRGEAVATVDEVTPAGEGSFRRSNTALPNDEDLPTTVLAQAPEAPATVPRGGLARDEGEITRIDSPADPDIYSDFAESDADYRTTAGEGSAQTGEPVAGTDVNVDRAGAAAEDAGHVDAGRGLVAGGIFGGLTGLLVGLGALAIPGLGPIIAAGPLAGAITGILAGGATGGIAGALLDAGVPDEHATALAGRVAGGDVLVSVQTDQVTHDAVVRTLQTHGAEEVH